jgi:hypothetical protein
LTEAPSTSPLRTILAIVASLCVSTLCLLLWYQLKQAAMSTWGEASIFFMPLVIGVAVGWVARRIATDGSARLGLCATLVTLLASVAGLTLQRQMEIDFFLKRFADATFDETLDYAKRTATINDPDALRNAMSGSEVAVVGRLVARQRFGEDDDFWFTRNFAHLHWVASRRIIKYGQSGPERTIFEASRVLKSRFFFDQIVATYANDPITDTDLTNYFTWEQPFLKQLIERQNARESFEAPLIKTVRANIDWPTLVSGGLGPLSGLCMILGCALAYKLASRPSEVVVDYA